MRRAVLVLIAVLVLSTVATAASAAPGNGQSLWGLTCNGSPYVGSTDPMWASPWGAVRLYSEVDGQLVDAGALALPVGYVTPDGSFAKPGPTGTAVACTVSLYPEWEATGWTMNAVLMSIPTR